MKKKDKTRFDKMFEEAERELHKQQIIENLKQIYSYVMFLIITTASIYTGYWLISKLLN